MKKLMLTPIVGEITEREPYNGYLIFQGGIPEVEEFMRIRRQVSLTGSTGLLLDIG